MMPGNARMGNAQNMRAMLSMMGRGNDRDVAHVAPADHVIPGRVFDENPALVSQIIKAMQKSGLPWRKFIVGGQAQRNPRTGLMEFQDEWNYDEEVLGFPSGGDEAPVDTGGLPTGPETADVGGGAEPPLDSFNAPLPGPDETELSGMSLEGTAESAYQPVLPPAYQDQSVFDLQPTGPVTEVPPPIEWAAERVPPEQFTQEPPPDSGGGMFGLNPVPGFADLASPVWGGTSAYGTGENLLAGMAGLASPVIGGLIAGVSQIPESWRSGYGTPEYTGPMSAVGGPETSYSDEGTSQAPDTQPQAAAAAPSFAAPPELTAPSGLGLEGLSPLQRRSLIASHGLSGQGRFRDSATRRYYRNLLQRGLVSDSGALGDYGDVLPIEQQYLRDVMGLTFQPNVKSLLDALAASED